jgi:hypothetical protein
MDAFLDERDEMQRVPSYGKIGLAAVVGNEDGAHHVAAVVTGFEGRDGESRPVTAPAPDTLGPG